MQKLRCANILTCLFLVGEATRFKHMRNYVYLYEVDTASGVTGTAGSYFGSKINCKVELEVPQTCHYTMRTSQCTLREVSGVDSEGRPLLKESKNSDDFAAAMSQSDLKFSIQDGKHVQLYPADNEPTHILNIKRGIISALLVPMETSSDQQLSMDTIYGKCDSNVEIQNWKSNPAASADIVISRNLKNCDNFSSIRDHVSPVALIKGLNTPLSSLISSNQRCQYIIDSKKKHISDVTCTEKHLFLPFSYKNEYGMMAKVTQTLKLEETPKINNRNFDGKAGDFEHTKKGRSTDVGCQEILQELQKLSVTEQNQKRASLFYRFVTGLRGLHNATLNALVPKMIETSSPITIQALAQCGTPECFGAILQVMRTSNVDPVVADAVTYTLGWLPSPCTKRIREILNMARHYQSRPSFYALSNAVNRFYDNERTITTDIKDVAGFMTSLINNECSGDEELTYLTLRTIGNMGKVMEEANPQVKHSLKTCIRSNTASPAVQKAAIQALRKMTITEEDQGILVKVFQESSSPAEKRLTAYLMMMRNPSPPDISKAIKVLQRDKNEQVKSFVASHIANILDSEDVFTESLKNKIQEALKGAQVPTVKDFRRFSRNYQVSLSKPWSSEPSSGKLEGNLLFDPNSYVPKESMLKTTLQLFGPKPLDVMEIGLDGKNFEPTLEALFGPKGFFPDSATRALYWVDGKVPQGVSQAIFDYFGQSKEGSHDLMKGIMVNLEKAVNEIRSKETPEARAYLQIFEKELGYLKLSDIKLLRDLFHTVVRSLYAVPKKIVHAISSGAEKDLFLHYIFMDNEFELPTGAGLQLHVAFSGVATPGAKVGVKISQRNLQAELVAKPSVAAEFITHMGVNFPEFAKTGVQMNTNLYHESGTEVHVALKAGKLKFTIPAPKTPTKLFSISNVLHLVSQTRTEAFRPLTENRESRTSCSPSFIGLHFCTTVEYPNASSTGEAPYFPLTGETRYEVELKPTGEVKEYSASANYEAVKEGEDLIDILKFSAQAEGVKQYEATLTFSYNRGKKIFNSDFQVPYFNIDLGTNFRLTDSSTHKKKAYALIVDLNNKKVPEVTLTGRIGYAPGKESTVEASISVPRLQSQAKTDFSLLRSRNGMECRIDSSGTIYGSSVSERIMLRYDDEKVEMEWNSGTSAALKKMSPMMPVDFMEYAKVLRKHANMLLDHQVANTDMTLRHIVSHLLTAISTSLQQGSRNVPYAQTIQDKLNGLQELKLQSMDFISIPEELFFRSDGQIKYIWNKDSMTITIPVPLGGKSSHDLRVPENIWLPPLAMPLLGVNMPSQDFLLPSFTIPKSYALNIPLLGTLEASSNVYSNYYNWSGSYSLANTTGDTLSLRTRYFMRADCVLDLLSYNIQGQGGTSFDQNAFSCDYENTLKHGLLSSHFQYSKAEQFNPSPTSKTALTFKTSSPLGAQFSLSIHEDAKDSNNLLVRNVDVEGQLNVASAFAKTTYTHSTTYDTSKLTWVGESNLKFDSSILQATNQITGRQTEDAWTITSFSNVQNGFLTNTASLKYQNSQLKLSSETAGNHRDFAILNKLDVSLGGQGATLRSEYQASWMENKYYALISGSANNRGAELISHVSAKGERNNAEHKSELSINQNGLASSSTSKLQFNLLMLENEMNAQIGLSGASAKINTNGRFGKHHAMFNLDGKVALTEVMLVSVYQGSISDADSTNTLTFKVNKGGLKFSNNLIGSYKEMKLEHTHDLNIVGLSLTYASNLDHTISQGKSHKHHLDFQLEPFSLTGSVNNELKYGTANVNNNARFQLEPRKINLDGKVKGAFGRSEVKHAYTFTCEDLKAHLKTDTVANIQAVALTHRVDLNVAGLSSTLTVNTDCHSRSLTFSNEVRTVAAPFKVTADMRTNADGRVLLLGEHSGKLYNKFLLHAEPLAFTFSHDYQGSTAHTLSSGKVHKTSLDNKATVLLMPSEQKSTWTMKTELNNNVHTQELSVFNDPKAIGVKLSGQTLADLSLLDLPINIPFTDAETVNLIDAFDLRENTAQPQEFALSFSVLYDKNEDMHVINLPFLEKLPVYYEQCRQSFLAALEAVQKSLQSVNVDQFVRKYKATLDKLSQQVNDYVDSFDLESKVNILKEKLDAFAKDYIITVEDFQLVLEKARTSLQEAFLKLQTLLVEAEKYIKESYDFRTAILQFIEQIVEKLKTLDRQYKISANMMDTIEQLQSVISQYDLSQIGSSAAAWAKNIDDQYKIKAQMQEKLDQLKKQIQSIDVQHIAESLKHQVEAIDFKTLMNKLEEFLPRQHMNQILEQLKYILLSLMEQLGVFENINVLQAKMHELIVNYQIDQQVKALMDKVIEFFKQQKIRETVQKLTVSLRKIDIKSLFNQLQKYIDDIIKQLQTFDFKNVVEEINNVLDIVIKQLKSFDYNKFVDELNHKIREGTQKINDEIRALELPQKLEAAIQLIKEVNAVVLQYIKKLEETRLAIVVDWLNDLLSSTAVKELKKKIRDYLEEVRDIIYQMDIPTECQKHLEKASQVYNAIITYLVDQWNAASKKIALLAEQYNVKNMADHLNHFVETGFLVPEIRTGIINMAAFEISLRALREATIQTPAFTVPFTDLYVPSYQINLKKLQEIRITARFTTPEFTILNTYKVPSYTIDLNEIKLKIVKMIDQIMTSDFQFPAGDVYFQDLKIKDMYFFDFSFPEMNLPELQIPALSIPTLNLSEFQFEDIAIPEFQIPRIPHSLTVPTFGKLSGAFRVASPFFTLNTNAGFQNVTTVAHSPEFVASVSAVATSKVDALAFSMTADTRLKAPEMQRLVLKDSLKFSHLYLKVDHAGEITFLRTSVQGNAETTINFHTARNAIELHNRLMVNLQNMISMESKTTYTHMLNVPKSQFTSQAELSNDIKTVLEAGHVSVSSIGKGNWKWNTRDYSDEGTHDSNLSFSVEGSVAAFVVENKINDKYLKVNQRLAYEYTLPSSASLRVSSRIESPPLGRSTLNLQGTLNLAELKVELQGAHEAKLSGRISGTISNDVNLLVQPFEISTSTNNEMNVKVSFPLKMVGKIEGLNKYGLILNPSTQKISWIAEGRFNQYKYAHNVSASNNDDSIEASVSMNGDANLEFLNTPLSIPQQTIPYVDIKTPHVQGYSLWEETGLKNLLKTTKQSFSLNLKAQYKKNKDVHSFEIPLDGVHRALNNHIKFFNTHFEKGRDTTLAFLTASYNQAKANFEKYKVDTSASQAPQMFKIRGYTIPVLNIEISPFTAELPAFGYVIPKEMSTPSFTFPFVGMSVPSYTFVLPSLELPVLHIPHSLQTLKLPSYRAHPSYVHMPALGNFTTEFSFKSSVITLNTNAGLFNQSDIIARLSSSSSSVIDALQYKLDGTVSLTRKRGLKLASALSLNNKFIYENHDSTISLTRKNIEASVTTTAKINIPGLYVGFQQELKGNAKSKPIITSTINLNYELNTFPAFCKGEVAHKVTLESILSYLSMDTSTKGSINAEFRKSHAFSGTLTHEANAYINAKTVRSAVKFETSSGVDGVWNFDTKENVAIEASTSRLYAVWEHAGENNVQYHLIVNGKGNQNCKVTFELAPGSMSAALQMQAAHLHYLFGETSVNHAMSMVSNNEHQKIDWKTEGQFYDIFLGHDLQLANYQTEIRFGLSESLGGHLHFLKHPLPVYERSLWDILKLDLTTRAEDRQYLNVSTAIVYTKNEDGYFFPLNVNQLADGFTLTIPEMELKVQNPVTTPEFSIPFTTLQVPSYTVDLREIKVPKNLTTIPFDIKFPSLPVVKFPKLDVLTSYEEYKIPYLEFTLPKHLLTVSEFTLPKTLSLSNMNVDLSAIAKKIADFELPTITIPEQQVEIPGFKIALPAGIYFPKFGALACSFKLDSPIYNSTWNTELKNNKGSFQHSIDLTASSPLQFLEYDLDGKITIPSILFFQLWVKIFDHTASLDITSPTFTDMQVRFQADNSKFVTSVSSSSAGTLGFQINQDTDVLGSKIYYRTQSDPQKDVDVFKSEISFKNPEMIQVKTNWEENGAMDLLKGLKEKGPRMADALYHAVNKYHQEHTGMAISTATSKLKDNLKDSVDTAYRRTLDNINEVEQQLRVMSDEATGKYEVMRKKARKLYRELADQADQITYDQIRGLYSNSTMKAIGEYHERMNHFIDSSFEYFMTTRFQVPGVDGKHTGEELYVMATKNFAKVADLCITKLQEYLNALIEFFTEVEVKIPVFNEVIRGSVILDEIKTFLAHMQNKVSQIFVELQEFDFSQHIKNLKVVVQQAFQALEELIRNLQSQNYDYVKDQAKQLSTKFLQALKSLAEDAKYLAPRVENFMQNYVWSISSKLEEFLHTVKELRKQYIDSGIAGWSEKYFEMEEQFLAWLKSFFNAVIEWHTKCVNDAAELVAHLTEKAKEFVENNGKITGLSKMASEKIQYWSEEAKKSAAIQKEQLKDIIQEAFEQLSNYYAQLLSESKNLIDLVINQFITFLQYLQKVVYAFDQSTADILRPYVAVLSFIKTTFLVRLRL
uniref:Apolipoprotein B n=1 Tax=Varanus komodoensis TaxID=61221 RepID=A0A8D2L261_VARKO